MLERNGLRHGGFQLREGMDTWEEGKVRAMVWSGDSEVLAIWVERIEGDVGMLTVLISCSLEPFAQILTISATVEYEELSLLSQARDLPFRTGRSPIQGHALAPGAASQLVPLHCR